MTFSGICVLVEDMERAKKFYIEVLGQKIAIDMGRNVTFEGGFSLQSGYEELLGIRPSEVTQRSNSFELYFEHDELESLSKRLEECGVEFRHGIQPAPWAQLSMRFYDPDGHIVEVGESMPYMIRRLMAQGMDEAGVSQRTGLPLEAIHAMLGN